ncbi:MAG: ATP-dependent Clp protease proteolytic subunit [Oscillospiraceae bacterium]|nr:ATP-dependent Clp protease proteolytic subunit [Oscillospiraceae bacterium]
MYYIPNIIRETSEGLNQIPIQDILFQRREVECIGEITEDSVAALILQLRYLHREAPEQEITMYINSPGGEVSSGLALYDVMKAIQCPIRTVCVGTAASMAAILFLSGDKRDMLTHSKVMIHDPLIPGGIGGSALKVDAVARNLMQTRQTIADIISRHTGKSLEDVLAKTASDSYFDAEQAVEWGLADRIIHEL